MDEKCSQCGIRIPDASSSGFCPSCVIAFALDDAPEEENDAHRFASYTLEETLGRGGMGIVYRARQEKLDRAVALKMIVGGELATPEALRRFRVEAEAAAHLDHPNIVPIYEVGEVDGLPYYTMRFVEGSHLADEMPSLLPHGDDSHCRQRRGAEILAKVALAVDHAHRHGILHRDLKPTNILVDRAGEPQLVDFGLAKRVHDEQAAITLSSSALGSPSYMAPEQSTGESTTASDVWSLGAILYEMLAGAPPFVGMSAMDTLRRVIDETPVPPRKKNPLISRDLETVCLKCLEKDPALRYPSAAAFADDLSRFLAGEPVSARPVSNAAYLWRWCRRNRKLAALAAALLVAIVIGILGITSQWHRATLANLGLAETVRHLEWRQLRSLEESGRARFAVAHLARRLRDDPGDRNAATYALSLLEERRFPQPTGLPFHTSDWKRLHNLCWDSDGEYIAGRANGGQVWILDGRDGSPLSAPTFDSKVTALAMNPGGTELAVGLASGGVRFLDPASGEEVADPWPLDEVKALLYSGDDSTLLGASLNRVECYREGTPARDWRNPELDSPVRNLLGDDSGKCVLAIGETEAVLLHAATGSILARVASNEKITNAARAGDGSVFALVVEGKVRVYDASGSPVAGPLGPGGMAGINDVALSRDGRLVAAAGRLGTIHRWTLPSGEPLGGNPEHLFSVESVDIETKRGSLLTSSGEGAAVLWNAEAGVPVSEPIWQSDRMMGAFFLGDDDRVLVETGGLDQRWHYSVWRIPDGTERPALVHDPKSSDCAILSRDGRYAAISSPIYGLSLHDLDGRRKDKILAPDFKAFGLVFSPDGSELISMTTDGLLGRRAIPSGEALGSFLETGLGNSPSRLAPDGRIFVAGGGDGRFAAFDVSVDRQPRELWSGKLGTKVSAVVFSPAGDRVALASNGGNAEIRDVVTGGLVATLEGHSKKILPVAFFPDGKRVVTGSYDFTARIWDAETGDLLLPPLPHRNQVTTVAVSSDGEKVVTGTRDGFIALWDSGTGEPLVEPMRENHAIRRVLFARGDNRLFVVSQGGVRQWDVATGEPITTLLRQDDIDGYGIFGDADIGFVPDRDRLLVGANCADVVLYDLTSPAEAVPDWFPDFLEAIAMQRIDAEGAPHPIGIEETLTTFAKVKGLPREERFVLRAGSVLK